MPASSRAASLEFFPAVLELEQTPPLPLGRAILWTIIALFTSMIAWAAAGSVDIVATASGKVVPDGRLKAVQSSQAGVIEGIFVAEGDHVGVGEVLVTLNATQAIADVVRLRQEQHDAHIEQIRIHSQLAGLGRYSSPADYFARPAAANILEMNDAYYRISVPRVVEALNGYYESVARIDQLVARNRAERTVLENRVAQLDATIPLIAERVAALEKLERRSLAPRTQWLELREQMVQKVTEKAILEAQYIATDAESGRLEHERAAVTAQTRSAWLTELAEVETGLKAVNQELRKANRRLAERSLTAPVTGTVHQLRIHTVGGVVSPAETLMYVVPRQATLRIDAWISNKDIGFVYGGLPVRVKMETFPFTRYGAIDGTVLDVSGDAVANEELGLVYLAQIGLAQTSVRVKDKTVNLAPGMVAAVEIQLGRRRIMEFLLSPLLRYRDEGLKER